MTEIPRETLSVADRNEILRKLTPCFEERVNAVKAFMDTPTHSIQQVILVEDAVAEMKAILFDANIVEAVVRDTAISIGLRGDLKMHRFAVMPFAYNESPLTIRAWLLTDPIGYTETKIAMRDLPALVEEAWQV